MMPLPNIFSSNALISAQAHALVDADKGEECCGAIVIAARGFSYVAIRNIAKSRSDEFAADESEWALVMSRSVAIFHSHHLDTQPGKLTHADIESARICNQGALLYHAVFEVWDYWHPDYWYPWPLQDHNKSQPKTSDFIGWQFEYGRADCWTLARSWFSRMCSIDVPDYPRGDIEELDDGAFDAFMQSYEKFGFVKIDGPMQDSDVLVMRVERYPTHCAIVLNADEGTGIHHLGQSMMSSQFQIERWQSKIHAVFRHRELC